MTINYTTLLGLAKPVTGTETGQWGDVVNDEITSLLEDAVANAATFSVTVGDVTLSTTNGASNQARMSTLIITGSPGILRNVIVPSQAKIYVVINQANAEVVIKGAATTGVTVGAGQTAQIAWNGSDFVEIGNYVHGNFVVNGNLSVNGNSTLGDGGADTTTVNGQFIGANSNISKATTVSTAAPALAWVKGATYTDTASAGGTTQAHAPFTLLSAPTLATSNIVTYTNASTFYIAGAPSASGSATITNPYAMYVAAGEAYLAGAVTMAATTQNLALGTSQTSGTWTAGGAAQTGALTLDQSTKTHTLNLGTGATESAATKTVNIGTAGVSGSTTAVNIGSAVSGATNNVTINGNPTFNSGTANGVLYLNGSKVATSGSALTFDGTVLSNTGASSGAVLEVLRLSNNGTGDGTQAQVSFRAAATNYAQITGGFSGGASLISNVSAGGYHASQIGGTEQMRLTSTGLGIGTSSPGAKLHVSNGSNSDSGDFTAFVFGGTDATNSRTASFIKGTSTPYNTIFRYQNNTGTTTGSLIFQNGSTEQMRLDSSGNLGIGTSSPVAKLHVAGDIQQDNANYLKGKLAAGTTTRLFGLNASNALYIGSIDADHTGGTLFVKNGATQMMLDSSGNLGLGVTPSGNYTLQTQINYASGFKGASIGGASIGSSSSGYPGVGYNVRFTNTGDAYNYNGTDNASFVTFKSGGFQFLTAPSGTAGNAISFTQAMTLDASGNLGINNTSPSSFGKVVVQVAGTTTPTNATNVGSSSINLYAAGNGGSTDCTTGIFGWSANNPGIGSGIGFVRESSSNWGTQIRFYTHPADVANIGDITERARITSGGDLGVGTISPNSRLDVVGGTGIRVNEDGSSTKVIQVRSNFAGVGPAINVATNDPLLLQTNNTERARITSGGDLLVGVTSTIGSNSNTNTGAQISKAYSWFATTDSVYIQRPDGTDGNVMQFLKNAGALGSISLSGSSTSYNTSSDRRLKENIQPADDAGAVIDAIQVVKHDWKIGGHTRYGMIAQDLNAVAPEAVNAGDDGDEIEKAWGVDYSKLVPMLIKEIQSLRARVAALEKP